jgi:hypothetical protein
MTWNDLDEEKYRSTVPSLYGTMWNDPSKPQQLSTVPLERGTGTKGGSNPPSSRSVPTLSLGVERGTICAFRRVAEGTFCTKENGGHWHRRIETQGWDM